MVNTLTLYRRHIKDCSKGYTQNKRIFRPINPRNKREEIIADREQKADCECPIAAEGKLSQEGRITNRSTKKTDWDGADEVAAKWEAWGSTVEPEAVLDPTKVSVRYAVDGFLNLVGPEGRNLGKSTVRAFGVLLNQRLIPYADRKQYLIHDFDSLDVVTTFFTSWENLQPTRNRKTTGNQVKQVLGATTKKAELERLRQFFRFCIDRGWMQNNPAMKLKVKAVVTKKFGMEPHEEEKFFKAVALANGGHGRTDEYNAQELRAFCLVMRHAGLRISDAITLSDSQVVKRASGKGSALKIFQKKTKEHVYIPVPDLVVAELGKLNFKGEKDGKKFWFWTGTGTEKTAQANWYRSIMNAVEKAGTFRHTVTPHTFRHTYAIRNLNAGMDIKALSRLLGHKSVAVTEKHYAHAIHGTQLALDAAVDLAMERQAVA